MKTILKIVLIFLFSFHFCFLSGQNMKADSIAQLLKGHKEQDTAKVNLYIKLALNIYYTDTDTVKVLAQNAYELSEKLNYKKGIANSQRVFGIYYDIKANYPKALEHYHKALRIAEEIGDQKIISDCLNSIGIIYTDQGNPAEAKEYFEKALTIYKELGYISDVSDCYNNLGVVYYDLKQIDKSLEYYLKSIENYKKLNNEGGIALVLNNIGEIYRDKGDYDLALDYFNGALAISKRIGDVYGVSYLYMDIASVYILTEEYTRANVYAQMSMQIAFEKDYFDIQKDVYLQLATIHKNLGDYKDAYENHVIHKRLNDSLYNEKDLEKRISLEYHYRYEKEKEESKLLQEEELKRQKLIRNSFIIGFLLLLLLTLLIIRVLLQKSKLNKLLSQKNSNIQNKSKLLQEQNEEIQQLYEELSAANEVLFTQKEELEKHRNNLEILVKERTIELERAKDKAEESDRLKSAFLANMSHEIRTPLNAILGFADLLADPEVDQNTKDELYSHMNHSTETLLKLIDDIFDIAKIESGQLTIKKEHVTVMELMKKLKPVYEDKKVKLDKSDITINFCPSSKDLVLYTDPIRLQQILINLIDNALKFTESGFVEITCDKDKSNADKIVFSVKDSGIGMDQKQVDYIFERFIKLEEDTTKIYRGAGLGLAICKNIVELLGGELWVESEVGKGSTFYFSIQIEK